MVGVIYPIVFFFSSGSFNCFSVVLIFFKHVKTWPVSCSIQRFFLFQYVILPIFKSLLLLSFYYYFYFTTFFIYKLFLLFILFFCCSFCFWFYFVSFNVWLNNSFSHMKRLRLVDYFVCLSVLFLNPKFQGNNRQPRYFSPALKRLRILFIYFYFNLILHLTLNFTLYFCHSFYYNLF